MEEERVVFSDFPSPYDSGSVFLLFFFIPKRILKVDITSCSNSDQFYFFFLLSVPLKQTRSNKIIKTIIDEILINNGYRFNVCK